MTNLDESGRPSGIPSWAVMATPDARESAAFYSSLFEWTLPDYGGGFAMFSLGQRPVAGMFELPPQAKEMGAAARWLVYVSVRGIGGALEHVVPAGGSILAPAFDTPDGGRMAMVTDPTGAEIGLWQPPADNREAAEPVTGPGTLTWTELYTRSRASSAGFYEKVFGWLVEDVQAGEESYMVASLGGSPVAGMMPIGAASGDMPSHWMPYFAVADADDAVARAGAVGAEVCATPEDLPAGRLAVLRDPMGALFFVVAEQASG
jgi:predicted enzyme related to lactoylglutathione lyase